MGEILGSFLAGAPSAVPLVGAIEFSFCGWRDDEVLTSQKDQKEFIHCNGKRSKRKVGRTEGQKSSWLCVCMRRRQVTVSFVALFKDVQQCGWSWNRLWRKTHTHTSIVDSKGMKRTIQFSKGTTKKETSTVLCVCVWFDLIARWKGDRGVALLFFNCSTLL